EIKPLSEPAPRGVEKHEPASAPLVVTSAPEPLPDWSSITEPNLTQPHRQEKPILSRCGGIALGVLGALSRVVMRFGLASGRFIGARWARASWRARLITVGAVTTSVIVLVLVVRLTGSRDSKPETRVADASNSVAADQPNPLGDAFETQPEEEPEP